MKEIWQASVDQEIGGHGAVLRCLLHIPLTLLLLTIITKIHGMQMNHHRNQEKDARK